MAPALPSVLCVDDSEDILLICRTILCRTILEAGGYQVFTASCSADTLELLRTHAMDAVIIDDVMPGMTGLELARAIRRTGDAIRVIMFSSTEHPDESFPFVDSYVSKGQGPIALRKTLGHLLRK
jgi:CheY-like chemotaxis protein